VRLPFRIVDVFTDRPLAGNQLAVVLDAGELTDERMQAVAREFNFSETTFVGPSTADGCDWRVRIFTPSTELPMAGHPTVGTAVTLEALGRVADRTVFELGVGPTPVRVRPGWAEMDQRPPTFGPEHPDPDLLAAALATRREEIGAGLPIQAVGTGLPHLMVPVRSLAALGALAPRAEHWDAALEGFPGSGVYAFVREAPDDFDARCRMFVNNLGVVEDPATGSAAGPLACFLTRYTSDGGSGPVAYRFLQGVEMGRPSVLEAAVDRDGEEITAVRVGGQARIVADGWLDLP
jgi:trans-2,3-dihydro-3-hydroxyanthranilate isomerase